MITVPVVDIVWISCRDTWFYIVDIVLNSDYSVVSVVIVIVQPYLVDRGAKPIVRRAVFQLFCLGVLSHIHIFIMRLLKVCHSCTGLNCVMHPSTSHTYLVTYDHDYDMLER